MKRFIILCALAIAALAHPAEAAPARGVVVVTHNTTIRGGTIQRLIIPAGVHVRLINVTVTGGNDFYGGGINNAGTLRLERHTAITGNSASSGGGIYNTGTLIMDDRSTVEYNATGRGSGGGGIYNTGTFVMQDRATVRFNQVHIDGTGGGVLNTGTLTMNDWSSIYGNGASRPTSMGGIVHLHDHATIQDDGGIHCCPYVITP